MTQPIEESHAFDMIGGVVCIMQPKLPLIIKVGIVIPIIANMMHPFEKSFSKFEN